MDQNGSLPGKVAGSGQAAPVSLSVYAADPAPAREDPAVPSQAALTGSLALHAVESLNQDEAGAVLSRLDHLIRWAQAQQAKTLTRMQVLFRDEYLHDTGLVDPGLAFSLAAEEAAAILHMPTNTAMMLMSEAGTLCTTHTATLKALESGHISYGHAQTLVDQSQNIPPADLPGFEAQLLGLAPEQTHPQFRVRARRLRETTYPETIEVRQRSAFDRRRVTLQPECDGMSWLSALLPAQKAQAFFNQLSTAARGEQAAGDPRTVDQLRTDIMASLLEGHDSDDCGGDCTTAGTGTHTATDTAAGVGTGTNTAAGADRQGPGAGPGPSPEPAAGSGAGSGTRLGNRSGVGKKGQSTGGTSTGGTGCGGHGSRARTEILVLISAETLFGADDQPAELHGYGPISPVTARRMARDAAKWTPVERDPKTEEFLRIGRKRKVPDRLKQVLRVRDGTCRFPGCRTNAVISEIDHTIPWAQGGATDHDNLEHLCRRHHMFKTKGFWKACQPSPGIIEWTSPGGRKYRTEPHLTLAAGASAKFSVAGDPAVEGEAGGLGRVSDVGVAASSDPDGYGDAPPPF